MGRGREARYGMSPGIGSLVSISTSGNGCMHCAWTILGSNTVKIRCTQKASLRMSGMCIVSVFVRRRSHPKELEELASLINLLSFLSLLSTMRRYNRGLHTFAKSLQTRAKGRNWHSVQEYGRRPPNGSRLNWRIFPTSSPGKLAPVTRGEDTHSTGGSATESGMVGMVEGLRCSSRTLVQILLGLTASSCVLSGHMRVKRGEILEPCHHATHAPSESSPMTLGCY